MCSSDLPSGVDLSESWRKPVGPDLPLRQVADPADDVFVTEHFQPTAPALGESDVSQDYPDPATGIGWKEDLRDTTRKLVPLRFQPGKYSAPEGSIDQWRREWAKLAPQVLGQYIVDLVTGLDEAGIYGDVLGFLPTTRTGQPAGLGIDQLVTVVKNRLKRIQYRPELINAFLAHTGLDLEPP